MPDSRLPTGLTAEAIAELRDIRSFATSLQEVRKYGHPPYENIKPDTEAIALVGDALKHRVRVLSSIIGVEL